jgi:hypothetical protein
MVSTAVRRIGLGTLGLAVCLAVGCGGPGLTMANVNKIKEGESTKDDVDKLLGSQGTKLEGEAADKYRKPMFGPGGPGGPGGPKMPGKGPGMPDIKGDLNKEIKALEEARDKAMKGKPEEDAKKIQDEYQPKLEKLQKQLASIPDLKMPGPGGPGFPGGPGGPGGFPGGPDLSSADVYRWGEENKGVVCLFQNGKVVRKIPTGL